MDKEAIKTLLVSLQNGQIGVDEALNKLKHLPYEDIEFAKIDHHRQLRGGIAEVIFGEGKKTEDAIEIARRIYNMSGRVLITRASKEIYDGLHIDGARYYPTSRLIEAGEGRKKIGRIVVVSAGTADIPVSEEAAVTASFLSSSVETLYDVGVAGLHRLLSNVGVFEGANVVIVAAGMEGALPSVVGSLIDKPIIAVPTSVGYGTSLGGLTPLFAMLNSCVPGIAVMNIDNGFGAGCLAHKINILAVHD
ncbi:nickel pincer cofactor biosynthesis protein LarB [Candidatus Magnetominusculus dajiuhuensis]|uniref:nickel pincer cofactor biosynthesis protein LarB n=1 Tax=Candidatus Magnetominusculus dajiuhuensis TaxID=3137712 RepID=UPI003B42E899